MGAEELRIQSDFGNPLRYKSRILPRRYRCETVTTSEQKVARLLAIGFEVFIDSIARRLGQFEPHGLAGFSLTHGGAIENDAIWGDILDSKGDDITAAQLTVDRKVEHGQVACPMFDLKLGPDRPYVFGSEWGLRSDQSALVPRRNSRHA